MAITHKLITVFGDFMEHLRLALVDLRNGAL